MSAITYAVWAFTAGALIPLMAILNGGLARATGVSIGTVSFGGVTRLISDESTAKTRPSYRDTPLLLGEQSIPGADGVCLRREVG